MSPAANGATSASQLIGAVNASSNLILTLNNNAHALVNQAQYPPLDIPNLTNINGDLQTAQTHADAWLDTYSGEVLKTLQGIVSYGDFFTNLYDSLLSSAQNLGTESGFNQNEIASLISQLNALRTNIQAKFETATQVHGDISTYSDNVNSDYSQFNTDCQAANDALQGEQGLIAQLQASVQTYNSALTSDNIMVGAGGGSMLLGGLLAVVGLLTEIPTAGLSTALVIGGTTMAIGGSAVFGIGSNGQSDALAELQQATTQLASASADAALLTNLKTSFSGINDNLLQTQGALTNLMSLWSELDNSLEQTVNDLQQPETYLSQLQQTDPEATPATVSAIVVAELETANDDWQSGLQDASTMLHNLGNIQFVTIQQLPTPSNIVAAFPSNS